MCNAIFYHRIHAPSIPFSCTPARCPENTGQQKGKQGQFIMLDYALILLYNSVVD